LAIAADVPATRYTRTANEVFTGFLPAAVCKRTLVIHGTLNSSRRKNIPVLNISTCQFTVETAIHSFMTVSQSSTSAAGKYRFIITNKIQVVVVLRQ